MLRVSVEGGGCSGFQYKFDIGTGEGRRRSCDQPRNAVVLIDPVSVNFMTGSKIEFVDDLIGASFKVKNRTREPLAAAVPASRFDLIPLRPPAALPRLP